MNLKILYQDENYVAVEKPSALLVHPYKKETNEKECLLKILRDQLGAWLYPVHRLDRAVSGAVVFGLNSAAVKKLQELWHSEQSKKLYLALVREAHQKDLRFSAPLTNEKKVPQESLTLAKIREVFERSTLMEVEIKTGRKHQIRRHFSKAAYHVIGDRTYGKKPINDLYRDRFGINRIFLHSHKLSFPHPFTSKTIEIDCPLPQDLNRALEKLRSVQNIKFDG